MPLVVTIHDLAPLRHPSRFPTARRGLLIPVRLPSVAEELRRLPVRERETLAEARQQARTLRAPHEGVVTGLRIRPGQYVTPGESVVSVVALTVTPPVVVVMAVSATAAWATDTDAPDTPSMMRPAKSNHRVPASPVRSSGRPKSNREVKSTGSRPMRARSRRRTPAPRRRALGADLLRAPGIQGHRG